METVNCIIFSNGSALPLRDTLDSFRRHCTDADRVRIHVLYACSSSGNDARYDRLRAEYTHVAFIREEVFKEQVLLCIGISEYTLLLVDDHIFTRDFAIAEVVAELRKCRKAVGFSLALGLNAEPDSGYPPEVSGAVFRSGELREYLVRLPFSGPGTLAGVMNDGKRGFRRKRRLLAFNEPVTRLNPVNGDEDVAGGRTMDGEDIGSAGPLPHAGPAVSVCMVTYNAARYIGRALGSAVAQTFTDTEIIVVDDGSTDSTREVVESFTDERIRYVRKEHTNVADSRNRYLAEARGEYLLILDSDDFLAGTYLEDIMRAAAGVPGADLVYPGQLDVVDEDGNGTGVWTYRAYADGGAVVNDVFWRAGGVIPNIGILVKRDAFAATGGYDATVESLEDFVYFARNAMRLDCRMAAGLKGYNYRVLPKSNSKRFAVRNPVVARMLNELTASYRRILMDGHGINGAGEFYRTAALRARELHKQHERRGGKDFKAFGELYAFMYRHRNRLGE